MTNLTNGSKLKLKNKYEIIEKCGTGGFGSVYKATNLSNNDLVAVKIFNPRAFNTNQEARMYWVRESKLVEKTVGYPGKHMSYIESYEDKSDRQNPKFYIVLGFVKNATTLKHWFNDNLRSSDPVGIDQMIKDVFLPLSDYMYHAQKNGAIHRDFTFNNIMIIKEKDQIFPIVIDWGGGREFDAQTLEDKPPLISEMKGNGTVIITPGFYAPEIIMQKPPLPQTDIYMFGAVLFYALTNGYTRVKPMVNADFVLQPQDYNMNIADTLNDIVEKCTQYEPKDRFRTFKEVNNALNQYISGEEEGLNQLPELETGNSFVFHILNNNAIIPLNPYDIELEKGKNLRIGREIVIQSAPWKSEYRGIFRGITRCKNRGKNRPREQFFIGYSSAQNFYYIHEGRNSNPTLLDGQQLPPNQWIPIQINQRISIKGTTIRGIFELISVLDLED